MEPLKPSVKQQILQVNPQAAPDDVAEYELLLSQRFTEDPDAQGAPQMLSAKKRITDRLADLYAKLFLSQKTQP